MNKVELENLIAEIKNGSLDKFEIIIDHFQQPIFTYCYHMLGHKQEAEDAVQDVLFRHIRIWIGIRIRFHFLHGCTKSPITIVRNN